jgi:3-oxoacyl-[acyl-carrier protein] reductase
MFDLGNKNALITGASGGIGGSIARVLHQHGASVTLSGTRRTALEEIAAELGERAYVVACNLAHGEGPTNLIETAQTKMGSVDILVNNAGLTRDCLALRMKDDDWHDVLELNLTSAFKLSRAALRGMLKRRWGRIINISSIVASTGNPGQANYAAAKAGLIGLTKSLAAETARRGITVNAVAPGMINTPMTQALTEDQQTALQGQIPTGRLGEPEDIAAGIIYLASDEAAYVTGQTLHINGGMAMI